MDNLTFARAVDKALNLEAANKNILSLKGSTDLPICRHGQQTGKPAATFPNKRVCYGAISKEASATPKETPASKDTVTDAPATKDAPDAKETVSYEKKIADLKADIQFHGSMGQAYGGMGQGGAAALNALGGFIAAQMDAEMALIDGETQVANITKETADKLRQKAAELIQACMQLMQNISQADYQTMTTIGRI